MNPLIGAIVGLLVLCIVVVCVVVPTVTDFTNRASAAQITYNEVLACSNASIVYLDNDNLVDTVVTLTNTTGTTLTSGNYSVRASDGRVWFVQYNATVYGANCYVTYDYYDDSYLSSGASRTIVQIIPLLIVVLLALAIVAYYKFK